MDNTGTEASKTYTYSPNVSTYNEHEGKLSPISSLPGLPLTAKSLHPDYSKVQQKDSIQQIQQEEFNQGLMQNLNDVQLNNQKQQQHKVIYQQTFETQEQSNLEKGQSCALEILTSIAQHVNNAPDNLNISRQDTMNSRSQDTHSLKYDHEYNSAVQNRLAVKVCQSDLFPQDAANFKVCQSDLFPQDAANFQVPLSVRKYPQVLVCQQNYSYVEECKERLIPNLNMDVLTAANSASADNYDDVNMTTDSKVTTDEESSDPLLTKDRKNNYIHVEKIKHQSIETQEGKNKHTKKEVRGDNVQSNNENSHSVAETVNSESEYLKNNYKCLCKDDFMNHAHNKVKKYICGSCCSKFISICLLHHHLELHGSGGSYHFDHVSHTAFPKYDTFCSFTQTESYDNARQDETVVIENASNTDGNETTIKDISYLHSSKPEEILELKTSSQRNRRKQVNPKPIKLKISYQNKGDRNRKSRRNITRKDKVNSVVNIAKEQSGDDSKVSQVAETALKIKDTEGDKIGNKGIMDVNIENSNEDEKISVLKPFKKRGRRRKSDGLTDTRLLKKSRMLKKGKKDVGQGAVQGHEIDRSQDKCKLKDKSNDFDEMKDTANEEQADDSKTDKVGSDLEVKQKVHKNPSKLEMCDVCGLPVPKYNYVYHMRKHTGEKPYVCDKCGKAFAHRRFLVKHLLIHVEDKPWKCDVCSAQFCQKTEYSVHMNAHQGNRPHECKVCGMKFLSKGMLNTHQANVHMGITRFECEVCNRRFFKRSSLNIHQATHFEATIKCQYCDKMFKDKTGLKRHERIHTGEKRFRCHICNHDFIQSTPYWVHMEKRHRMDRESVKNMLKDIRENNKRYGIRTEINVLPKDVDHLLINQDSSDTNRSKTSKSAKKNASEKSDESLKSHNVDMVSSYTTSAPFQRQKDGEDSANAVPQKSCTNIKVPNVNTSTLTTSNTYSSMDNNEPFSLQQHYRYINSSQEPCIIQSTDCGPGSTSLQEVTSASSQSLGLPTNIPVPVSMAPLALPMNSLSHGFIGINPIQQAIDFSNSLPPNTGNYTDISHH